MKKQFKIQAVPFEKEKIEAGDIVYIESFSAYGIVESYDSIIKDGFPYKVTSSAVGKRFKEDELQPIFLAVISPDKPSINNYIIGKCNNISTMRLEIMKVSAIMTYSKSICCDGTWTDGSEQKIIAAFPEYKYIEMHPNNLPTLSVDFVADWCLNPVDTIEVELLDEFSFNGVDTFKVVNNEIIANIPKNRLELEASAFVDYIDNTEGTDWSNNLDTLAAKIAEFANSDVVKNYWFEKFNEECAKSITVV